MDELMMEVKVKDNETMLLHCCNYCGQLHTSSTGCDICSEILDPSSSTLNISEPVRFSPPPKHDDDVTAPWTLTVKQEVEVDTKCNKKQVLEMDEDDMPLSMIMMQIKNEDEIQSHEGQFSQSSGFNERNSSGGKKRKRKESPNLLGENEAQCFICEEVFDVASYAYYGVNFPNHVRKCVQENLFDKVTCPVCKDKFKDDTAMVAHLFVHMTISYSLLKFIKKSNMRRHKQLYRCIRQANNIKPVVEPNFYSGKNLTLWEEKEKDRTEVACTLCGQYFAKKDVDSLNDRIIKHVFNCVNRRFDSDSKREILPLECCRNNDEADKDTLLHHILTVHMSIRTVVKARWLRGKFIGRTKHCRSKELDRRKYEIVEQRIQCLESLRQTYKPNSGINKSKAKKGNRRTKTTKTRVETKQERNMKLLQAYTKTDNVSPHPTFECGRCGSIFAKRRFLSVHIIMKCTGGDPVTRKLGTCLCGFFVAAPSNYEAKSFLYLFVRHVNRCKTYLAASSREQQSLREVISPTFLYCKCGKWKVAKNTLRWYRNRHLHHSCPYSRIVKINGRRVQQDIDIDEEPNETLLESSDVAIETREVADADSGMSYLVVDVWK